MALAQIRELAQLFMQYKFQNVEIETQRDAKRK
jgi:hypothetical protein